MNIFRHSHLFICSQYEYIFAGKNSFVWFGPVPCVNIMEPQMIKEVLMRYEEFQKPNINPILKMFVKGLVVYEGQKWAKHRKILNPAFHMEKLKVYCTIPAFNLNFSLLLACTKLNETEEWSIHLCL